MKYALAFTCLVLVGAAITYANPKEPTIYLTSQFVHSDGTKEPIVIQSPLKNPPVQPLPIKKI